MNQFTHWLELNFFPHKHDYSDWISVRGLCQISYWKYMKYIRKGEPSVNKLKVLNALILKLDDVDNPVKGINLTANNFYLVRSEDLARFSSIEFENMSFNTNLPVYANLENVVNLSVNEYQFLVTHLEFKFEYIVYPKFLMRNSSVVNFDSEIYAALQTQTKEILENR
jgi:hypothetical protein